MDAKDVAQSINYEDIKQQLAEIVPGINTDDATAVAGDIALGKTAYAVGTKVTGTLVPLDTSDATATADRIIVGMTAYVNGVKVTGTLPDFVQTLSLSLSVPDMPTVSEATA